MTCPKGARRVSVDAHNTGYAGASRLNIGDDWMRHVVAAFAALSCSGLLRLLEHFVSSGTKGVA